MASIGLCIFDRGLLGYGDEGGDVDNDDSVDKRRYLMAGDLCKTALVSIWVP